VSDVLTRMLHAIDALDWDGVRAAFAEEVDTDYTSLWGGEPAVVSIDDLIAGWQALADGLDATQHLTGPILTVNGRLETHIRASHWLDGEGWTVFGHYIARVEDGRIAALTLQTYQQEGNRDIPDRARALTAGGQARRTRRPPA
jgi:hypothetical protein